MKNKEILVTFLNNGAKYRTSGTNEELLEHFKLITTSRAAELIRSTSLDKLEEIAQISVELDDCFEKALAEFDANPVRESVMSILFGFHVAVTNFVEA